MIMNLGHGLLKPMSKSEWTVVIFISYSLMSLVRIGSLAVGPTMQYTYVCTYWSYVVNHLPLLFAATVLYSRLCDTVLYCRPQFTVGVLCIVTYTLYTVRIGRMYSTVTVLESPCTVLYTVYVYCTLYQFLCLEQMMTWWVKLVSTQCTTLVFSCTVCFCILLLAISILHTHSRD